ncbi:hypothetical protein EPI10_005987 [Gossypium australe]|uniref:Uncharacterized protein n=1 Tax=Gossypium australe TaxID=47621 RepID=A0A5B6WSR5_9ROSI|nr:hypothetical protein EPI10_005987 [Gossypium australe]
MFGAQTSWDHFLVLLKINTSSKRWTMSQNGRNDEGSHVCSKQLEVDLAKYRFKHCITTTQIGKTRACDWMTHCRHIEQLTKSR